MKTYFIRTVLLAFTCPLLLLSCNKKIDEYYDTVRGSQLTMGNGKANSIFIVSKSGIPQQIGIEMTEDALVGLTQDPNDHAKSMFNFQLDKRAKALLPFDHLVVHWNPGGHIPAGVFDKPHFDFHYYMMTNSERNKIEPYGMATEASYENLPKEGFMPANYIATPGGEEQMGKHWVSKHLNLPFTHTMIYGSYDGKVNFIEPMVTKAFIENTQSINVPYEQPARFEFKDKYYPTEYNIYRDATTRNHYITLSGFVLR